MAPSTPSYEMLEAAETLLQLADLVEQSGLTAADVGEYLLEAFRSSPVEQPADIRRRATEMSLSTTDTVSFVKGLREQAAEIFEHYRSTPVK